MPEVGYFFLSHSIFHQSILSRVLVFVFQRGRELKGCRKRNNTTQPCDGHHYITPPPPTHYCLQHPPTIVVLCHRSHSFNTKAEHKPPASTNTVFTTKTQTQTMKLQQKNTGNRTYLRKLPLNISNLKKYIKFLEGSRES